ncbi:MAG: peptidylprolyl isomerase [Acidimicrobiales bacterium]
MPSEKRARQRAGRIARREAVARHQKRRRQVRSSFIVVLVAIVVVGSFLLITRHNSPKATKTPLTAQGKLEAIWAKAGCPKAITTRVNTQSYKTAPPLTISSTGTYDATVKTDVGTFVIALDSTTAPTAVNSFVFLAKRGFFNCDLFHRVIKTFVDQTGDPTGTGQGGPGYAFTEQGPPTASPQYPIGSVAMANSNNPATTDPTTNGSQWFVVTGAEGETLAPNYVLFGHVTSGMSVAQKINQGGAASTATAGTPKLYHRILSVTIKETPA